MQINNNTRESLGQLAEAARQMAAGFDRAGELPEQSEGREAMRDALAVLREMRHAVLIVGADDGEVWKFHPDELDVTLCENCGKTFASHVGDDCKCP